MRQRIDCLVISHNRPRTLRRCVQSLRIAADEAGPVVDSIIHVQDDSTEGYEEIVGICQEFGAVLHHTEPCCQAVAWERAFEKIGSDFVKLLLDDDWVHPDYLSSTYKVLSAHPEAHLVISEALVVFQDRPPLHLYRLNYGEGPRIGLMKTRRFLDLCMTPNNGGMPESPSVCMFRNTGNNIKIRYKEFEGTPLEQVARKVYFNDLVALMDVARGGEHVLFLGHPHVFLGTDAESITLTRGQEVGFARHLYRQWATRSV